jgi:hypothetical protein
MEGHAADIPSNLSRNISRASIQIKIIEGAHTAKVTREVWL